MKNSFEIRGGVTAIFLNSSKYGVMETLISTNKLEIAKSFEGAWCAQYTPSTNGFYVRASVYEGMKNIGAIFLHRILSSCPEGMIPDHINGNGLDNRDENIRIVTEAENLQNKRIYKNNTSGFRGVVWHKKSKVWHAHIRVNGKRKHLGSFNQLEDAARTAEKARSDLLPFSNSNLKEGE